MLKVNRIIEHEGYNVPTYLHNDVALMFLLTPLVFSPAVAQIRVAETGTVIPGGTLATVSGWGNTQKGGSPLKFCKSLLFLLLIWRHAGKPMKASIQLLKAWYVPVTLKMEELDLVKET